MPRHIVDPEVARQGHTCRQDHDIILNFQFPKGKVTPATEKRRARASLSSNQGSPFRVTPAYVPPKPIPRDATKSCDCTHDSDFCIECTDEEEREGQVLEDENPDEGDGEDLHSASYYNPEDLHDTSLALSAIEATEEDGADIDLYFSQFHDEDQELELEQVKATETQKPPQKSRAGQSKRGSLDITSAPASTRIHQPLKDPKLRHKSPGGASTGSRTSRVPFSGASGSVSPVGDKNSTKYINYLSNRSSSKMPGSPTPGTSSSSGSTGSPSPRPSSSFSPVRTSSRESSVGLTLNNNDKKSTQTHNSRSSLSSSQDSSRSPSRSTGMSSHTRSSSSSYSLSSNRSKSPSSLPQSASRSKSPHTLPPSLNKRDSSLASTSSSISTLTPVGTPTRSKSPSLIPVRSPSGSPSKVQPDILTPTPTSPSKIPVLSPSGSPSKVQPDILTPTPTSPSKIPVGISSSLRNSSCISQTYLDLSTLSPQPTQSEYEPSVFKNEKQQDLSGSSLETSESNDFNISPIRPLGLNYKRKDGKSVLNNGKRLSTSASNTTSSHSPQKSSRSPQKSSRHSISSYSSSPVRTKNSLSSQSVDSSLTPQRKESRRQSSIPFQNSTFRLNSRKSMCSEDSFSSPPSSSSLKVPKALLPSASASAHFSVNSLAILGFSSAEYTELFSGIAIDLEPLTIRAFDKPNPKMLMVILHFLLVILDSDQFPKSITTCWPYLDLAERAQFRRACFASLSQISATQNEFKDSEDFSSPLLLPAHFSHKVLQEASGQECWELIRILCDLCLEKEFENPHDPAWEENPNHVDIQQQLLTNMTAIQASTEAHLAQKKELMDYLGELQDRYLQCKRYEVSNDHTNFISEVRQCNLLMTKINSKKEVLASICHSPLFPHVHSLLQVDLEQLAQEGEQLVEDAEDLPVAKLNSRMKLSVDPNLRQFQFRMSEAIETLTQNLTVLCENLHFTA